LENINFWAAVVLINGMIMTLLMWHVTAMVIMIGAAFVLGGIGLNYFPGTVEWWQMRPF